ncbi:uncharacterized protein LOC126092672 [Schistocerca cancellata]|uniref:uncharacterized protein LOC126092672 n=1 Tax=Schistocerca cancellata TaxID=274614 RepID=UPI002118D3A2|nr:uncharacterized protein LOC126092672 [Schistocerca cancellata]
MTENETGYYSQWESSLNESNTSEATTSSPLYLAWWTLSSSSNVTATTLVVNASTPDFSLDEDGNATEGQNCTNDYCIPDIDYWNMVYQHVYPKDYEWILIAMHSLVFVAGLVGNALVCLAVYRNHAMRTVTNYFIVNLAVADFMVILFCLPPTVLWDVTETWFMGTGLCKVVLYLQRSPPWHARSFLVTVLVRSGGPSGRRYAAHDSTAPISAPERELFLQGCGWVGTTGAEEPAAPRRAARRSAANLAARTAHRSPGPYVTFHVPCRRRLRFYLAAASAQIREEEQQGHEGI